MIPDFVQIHNHSQFSKFDGFSKIPDMVAKAKKSGMKAVGLTDHGTFAGAIQMIKTCREHKIKPILGMEAYLARDHKCKKQADGRKGNRHINVIAKNYEGYQNICKLSQISSLEGMYYDPRIDYELLEQHKAGVICTSACLSNLINANLLYDRYDEAKKAASYFKDIFQDDFYLEMMYHGIDAESKILPDIQKLSKELDIKTIVTNDTHYVDKKDADAQKVLMCMSSGRSIKDPKRINFPYDEFYFKTKEEMYKVWNSCPQSMQNTLEIAEKCDYSDIVFGRMLLPKFDIPEGFDNSRDYLKHLAIEGLKRLNLHTSKPHIERLKQELGDMYLIYDTKRFDFATYFLIIWDIMKHAKDKKIEAGVRGSGCGSLICYCLGISNLDPLAHRLLWERFLGFEKKFFISPSDVGL